MREFEDAEFQGENKGTEFNFPVRLLGIGRFGGGGSWGQQGLGSGLRTDSCDFKTPYLVAELRL